MMPVEYSVITQDQITTPKVKFGLRKKGEQGVLTYSTTPNEGDFCTSIRHTLNSHHYDDEPEWLVDSFELADWVLHNSTPWYNASYDHPESVSNPAEYEVVRVEISTLIEVCETSDPLVCISFVNDYRGIITKPEDTPRRRNIQEHGRLSALRRRYPEAQLRGFEVDGGRD